MKIFREFKRRQEFTEAAERAAKRTKPASIIGGTIGFISSIFIWIFCVWPAMIHNQNVGTVGAVLITVLGIAEIFSYACIEISKLICLSCYSGYLGFTDEEFRRDLYKVNEYTDDHPDALTLN